MKQLDSIKDWMKFHSKKGLAQVVVNGQKTIAGLAKRIREMKMENDSLVADNIQLLKLLEEERDNKPVLNFERFKRLMDSEINKPIHYHLKQYQWKPPIFQWEPPVLDYLKKHKPIPINRLKSSDLLLEQFKTEVKT